ISDGKEQLSLVESLYKTLKHQTQQLNSKLIQQEKIITKFREENEDLLKQLSVEKEDKENILKQKETEMETLQNQLLLQRKEIKQLEEFHLKSLEELNCDHTMESESLIQKYEQRIADMICSQNSHNINKEYQMSLLQSQVNSLKYQCQFLKQKQKLTSDRKAPSKKQNSFDNRLEEDKSGTKEDIPEANQKCDTPGTEEKSSPKTYHNKDLEHLKQDLEKNLCKVHQCSSSRQLREVVKLFIERYVTLHTHCPRMAEMVTNAENVDAAHESDESSRCDYVNTSLVQRTVCNQPTTNTTCLADESYRMYLIETDLNYQTKLLLELLHSYSNLQDGALQQTMPSLQQKPQPPLQRRPQPPPLPQCCCYSTV
ncbi:hypothetical protein Ahia01_000205100, partial [Argonauta hians]